MEDITIYFWPVPHLEHEEHPKYDEAKFKFPSVIFQKMFLFCVQDYDRENPATRDWSIEHWVREVEHREVVVHK